MLVRNSLPLSVAILCALLLAPRPASADRGALTLAGGVSPMLASVPAPYTMAGTKQQRGFEVGPWLEARYALSHRFELGLVGFYEAPATYWHSGVNVIDQGASYPGTLKHQMVGYGALANVRAVFGMIWRPVLALDVGFARRSYSGFMAIDDSDPRSPRDYGLPLAEYAETQLMTAVGAGLEWSPWTPRWLEKVTFSVVPRLQMRLGGQSSWAVVVPFTVGWSWYQ